MGKYLRKVRRLGLLHRAESLLTGTAAIHVAAITHHTTEAVVNSMLASIVLASLVYSVIAGGTES